MTIGLALFWLCAVSLFTLRNAQSTCPFSLEGNISSSPQNNDITYCVTPNPLTCCTENYIRTIGARQDLFNSIFNSYFSNVSPTCSNSLVLLTCSPCYHDSNVWTEALTGSGGVVNYRLTLCASLCSSLYASCSGSTVAGRSGTVGSLYSTPEMFCSALFQGSRIVANIDDSSVTCLDPNTRDCDENDIDYYYTPCIDGRRDLRYAWKANITCTGGIRLPSNLRNLPCPISCPAGSFLPLGTQNCVECPSGSFSLGGGIRFHDWQRWPSRILTFSTYCVDRWDTRLEGCTGWTLNDTYLNANIEGRHSTKSVLETQVTVKQNSTVSFRAFVDSEYSYDKFIFDLDSTKTWIKNSIGPVLSTFSLTPGHHVLKWIYSKDSSINIGLDSVALYMIEITDITDHSDFCSVCLPGTTSNPNSKDCYDCPMDTYNPDYGSPLCYLCPDGYYSLPGSTVCTPRPACTANDAQLFGSPCTSFFNRTLYYDWKSPKICVETNYTLPLPRNNEPCPPCNPGEYRVGDNCKYCPVGTYSTQGNEGTCTDCPAGSYAPKQISILNWDSWPKNSFTYCDGDCGTRGWRLGSTYIDSGTNHGSHSYSIFELHTEIETVPSGSVTFTYSLVCEGWCYVELYDGVEYVTTEWNDLGSTEEVTFTSGPWQLATGQHNLTWTFGKFFSARNADHAKIYDIMVDGVSTGGASFCNPCSPGTVSPVPTDGCSPCPPGSISIEGQQSCEPCPADHYQDEYGKDTCKPCGASTTTPPGSATCGDSHCKYTLPGPVTYDLSGIQNTHDGMFGAVEFGGQYFYVSPCEQKNQTSPGNFIRNEEGTIFRSFAVAVDQSGVSRDLGRIMGVLPSDGSFDGFSLSFTQGDICEDKGDVARSMTIRMMCDPASGVGFPVAAVPMEPQSCQYNLEWSSIYGCSACTEDDYISISSGCKDGSQDVHFVWKDIPKRCSGGVELPDDTTRNCSSVSTCSVGKYLGPDETCVFCEPDTYSLGNAVSYGMDEFNDPTFLTTTPFSTCPNAATNCTRWSAQGGKLVSGDGYSWFEYTEDFKSTDSSIEFDYIHLAAAGNIFTFSIDDIVYLRRDNFDADQTRFSKQLNQGTHSFRWEFSSFPPKDATQHRNQVIISTITVTGNIHGKGYCNVCPEHTISADDLGSCKECPLNFKAIFDNSLGRRVCRSCPVGYYRLAGMQDCQRMLNCTAADSITVVPNAETSCNVSSTEMFLEPQICLGTPSPSVLRRQCTDCPRGTIRSSDNHQCLPCPAKTYYDSYSCIPTEPGSVTAPVSHYFYPDILEEVSPGNWRTFCLGNCGSQGWRIFGMYADSGLHFGSVQSVLTLFVDIEPTYENPTVSFIVNLKTQASQKRAPNSYTMTGLKFFIDGVLQDFPFFLEPSVDTSTKRGGLALGKGGSHVLEWVYIQTESDTPSIVSLKEVKVTGSSTGVATQKRDCPAGSYDDGNNNCMTCIAGTYSKSKSTSCSACPDGTISTAGASQCEPCGLGTVPSSQQNACSALCTFTQNSTGHFYDLRNLRANGEVTIIPNNGELDANKYRSYEVSICDKFTSYNCKMDESCKQEKGYVFGEFGDEFPRIPRILGTWFEWQMVEQQSNPVVPFHTFNIVYSRSTLLPINCTSVTTTIQFFCSPFSGAGIPIVTSYEDKCNPIMMWRSKYACRLCVEGDIKEEVSPCKDDYRTRTYIYSNCWERNPKVSTVEPCADIEVSQTTVEITLAVSIILVSLGIGFAIYFFRKKRKMEFKYSALQSEITTTNTEL